MQFLLLSAARYGPYLSSVVVRLTLLYPYHHPIVASAAGERARAAPQGLLSRMDRFRAKQAALTATMRWLPRAQIQSEESVFSRCG